MIKTKIPFNKESTLLLEKLNNLWKYSNNSFQNHTFENISDLRYLILISITAASHRIVRAMLAEIKGGATDGLDFLLRPIIEGMINIKYILEDKTQMRARAFIVDDIKDRLKSIKRIIPLLESNSAPGMATVTDADRYKKLQIQLDQELRDFETQFGKENLTWPSLKERSRKSKTEELYATAFWLLSLDTHLTARGLDRYMQENDKNIIVEIGQDLSRFYMNIRSAYISYLALLNECHEHLGILSRRKLDSFDL